MIKQLALVQTQDRNVNQLQQNIKQTLQPILNNPLVDGLVKTAVQLQTGNNTIPHGLGRTLQGWIPVRYHGAWAQIYDLQDTNQDASTTLILNASAPAEIDLYLF